MPLQGVRDRDCVTVTYPSDPVVDALFDRLGGALAVADEAAFAVFSALSATMSTHLAYLATITDWAVRHGIPRADAGRFVRSIFGGVGRALGDESQSLQQMLADHETPEGINERLRTTWFDSANSDKLNGALDSLLGDLETGPVGE